MRLPQVLLLALRSARSGGARATEKSQFSLMQHEFEV